MTTNEYPLRKVFLSYMVLGSAIGSVLTLSTFLIFDFELNTLSAVSLSDVIALIAFIFFYGLIGSIIGIIPASITGFAVIKKKNYKNSLKDYAHLIFLGFLISFIFYSIVIAVIFGAEDYLSALNVSMALGGVGAISSAITGYFTLPKSLNKEHQ
ncbi:MAG: hypothetical protein Q4C68_03615 [Moraxella sp.]|nr:hypothetical protein [Moraxella sp.]